MTAAVIIIGSVAAIVGISVATWSIINTRKTDYKDYMRRKRGTKD